MVESLEAIARRFDSLKVTASLDTRARRFHERPFAVIDGERFAVAIRCEVADHKLRRLSRSGPIDCVSDNTDVLERPGELVARSALMAGS